MINTLRHQEVFDSSEYFGKRITIVGGGSIGSHLFSALASTGLADLTVIDYDKVESHNLANQVFMLSDVGRFKVDACKQWAIEKGCAIDDMGFFNHRVDAASVGMFIGTHIVICCVDSFDGRRVVQEVATEAGVDMFVEAGMASQHTTTFMFNPMVPANVREWRKTLGADDDPTYETSACGEGLTVGSTAAVAGNAMAWNVMNFLKTGYVEKQLRIDMSPFFVSRNSQR